MKKRIIFATGNEGKMKEVRMILSDLGYEVLSMKEANIHVNIVEDGATFEENAMIKAKAIGKLCNDIVLADDSGLEVDYMDKQPGIYSARFLGEDTSYDIKNQYILDKLFDYYFEGKDEEFKKQAYKKAQVIGYTRMLRRTLRRHPDNTELIEYTKKRLIEVVNEVDSLAY